MFRYKEFTQVMNECFDITDDKTRKILLAVNETDQNQVLRKLVDKLYMDITTKVNDIDYGEIPNSKGDITKLPNYEKLIDSITLIKDILAQYKQDASSIEVIQEALNNMVARKDKFILAHKVDVEFLIVFYNTIVLAIISSVAYLTSACVEFIKEPNMDNFTLAVDKTGLIKSKEAMLFNNLKKFNSSCKKGEMDKVIDHMIKNGGDNFLGAPIADAYGVMTVVVLSAIALMIIPMMRELIFFFYRTRVRVSDYFDLQADLLQANVSNLKSNTTHSAEEKKKIIARQEVIAKNFRNISNVIQVKVKSAEVQASKDLTQTKKQTADDVMKDELPDSAASALF